MISAQKYDNYTRIGRQTTTQLSAPSLLCTKARHLARNIDENATNAMYNHTYCVGLSVVYDLVVKQDECTAKLIILYPSLFTEDPSSSTVHTALPNYVNCQHTSYLLYFLTTRTEPILQSRTQRHEHSHTILL